jgi:hypothetical protein
MGESPAQRKFPLVASQGETRGKFCSNVGPGVFNKSTSPPWPACLANRSHVATSGKTLARCRAEFSEHHRCGQPMDLHDFVPRGVAADQLHLTARAIQLISQQSQQSFVRRRVHGWSGDLDAKLAAADRADFIPGGARLQFERERDAIRLRGQEGRRWGARIHSRSGKTAGPALLVKIFTTVHFAEVLPEYPPK